MNERVEGHRRWIRGYYPGLDGLRGIAIILVFFRHYGILVVPSKLFYAGWVGVDLFFVLSGFLITGILFDAREQTSYYRNFYVRRALRILPLLYLLTLIAWVLRFLHVVHFHLDLISYPLFFGNLLVHFVDLEKHNPDIIAFSLRGHSFQLSIGYLWSLCVEEQFYLVWPWVVARVTDRKQLMRLCVVLIVAVLLTRVLMFCFAPARVLATNAIYGLTFTRADTLLIGAWMALWLRGTLLKQSTLRTLGTLIGGGSLALLLLGAAITIRRWPTMASNPFLSTIGYTLVAIAGGALLLLTLDEESTLTKWLTHPWLVALGTVSYGFYVLHNLPLPIVTLLLTHATLGQRIAIVTVTFILILLIALASFIWFEGRFLRLKAILAPRRDNAADQPGI